MCIYIILNTKKVQTLNKKQDFNIKFLYSKNNQNFSIFGLMLNIQDKVATSTIYHIRSSYQFTIHKQFFFFLKLNFTEK